MTWRNGLIAIIWVFFIGYWFVCLFVYRTRKIKKYKKGWFIFGSITGLIVTLVASIIPKQFLQEFELPLIFDFIANLFGIPLLFFGLFFAIWARKTLGSFWSGLPLFIESQPIIKKGPYAIVRHPIYTALIAMLWGSFFVRQLFLLLFIALLGTIILYIKATIEEGILLKYCNEEYRRYTKEVPRKLFGLSF